MTGAHVSILPVVFVLLTVSQGFLPQYQHHHHHHHHHHGNFGERGAEITVVKSLATPIDPQGWPDRFPAKEHCSKCGLCETTLVSKVTTACAFLGEGMARMDELETKVHGRQRDLSDMAWSSSSPPPGNADEARFGVLFQPVMLAKGSVQNAQWTGCVTGIALAALESGMVDAVVCIANQEGGEWSNPEPIIAKTADMVLKGRGVKPALAPSLRVLDDIKADPTIKKLLFCGVGCAVQGKTFFLCSATPLLLS